MSIQDLMAGANYRKAIRKAQEILDRFGVDNPPVNPVYIAKELGIAVNFVEMSPESQNVSGFYDAKENSINVNEDEYPLRQTFTLGHELGHALLHAEWAHSREYKVLKRDQLFSGNDPKEREANVFAANLLVPKSMLDRYYKEATIEELSRLFAVSAAVIKNRIEREYGK